MTSPEYGDRFDDDDYADAMIELAETTNARKQAARDRANLREVGSL